MGIKTKIRTLHLREKKSVSEIARKLGLSRNTVRKWLNDGQGAVRGDPLPRLSRRLQPGEGLHPGVERRRGADDHGGESF